MHSHQRSSENETYVSTGYISIIVPPVHSEHHVIFPAAQISGCMKPMIELHFELLSSYLIDAHFKFIRKYFQKLANLMNIGNVIFSSCCKEVENDTTLDDNRSHDSLAKEGVACCSAPPPSGAGSLGGITGKIL